MAPVNLSTLFDPDGISFDTNRATATWTGKATRSPAKHCRPTSGIARPAPEAGRHLYPCGLWTQPVSQGDRVPFWYPDKRDGGKNLLSCAGQRLELPAGAALPSTCLAPPPSRTRVGEATLVYRDGSTSKTTLEMSSWTEGPKQRRARGLHRFAPPRRRGRRASHALLPVPLYPPAPAQARFCPRSSCRTTRHETDGRHSGSRHASGHAAELRLPGVLAPK